MKNLSLLLLLSLILISCTKRYDIKDLDRLLWRTEDITYYTLKGTQDTIENGNIYIVLSYDNTEKEKPIGKIKNKKKEGIWYDWYENGNMKYKCSFKEGENLGECKRWYTNGQLEYYWINGVSDEDNYGKGWYESGELMYIWEKGGVCTNFYKTGEVSSIDSVCVRKYYYYNLDGSLYKILNTQIK